MSGRPLSELTEDPVTEEKLQKNWRAIQRRRAPEARPDGARRWAMVGGAVAMAAAVALFLTFSGDPAPGPLALADGGAFDHVGEGVTRLADGSRITLFDDARMEVLESSGQRVLLRLAEGRARFEVTPGGPRRWIIEAGARVEVVGTVFSVDRADGRVEVAVERGVVLVRAEELPDGVRRLTAGQQVRVRDARAERTIAQAEVDPTPAPEAELVPAEPEAASEEPAADEAAEPATVVEAEGPAHTPRAPSPARLMARADAARADGDHDLAARWLRQLLERHPRDGRAPMAAVTLGRLELRQLSRPGRAADTFERALRMRLPASLEEDVRALRVEALTRAGRGAAAREAASEYHRRYPNGRWTSEVQRWAP